MMTQNALKKGFLPTMVLALFLLPSAHTGEIPETVPRPAVHYENVSGCRGCHPEIFREYSHSAHASSFTDPVFQAVFVEHTMSTVGEMLLDEQDDGRCVQCHAPAATVSGRTNILARGVLRDLDEANISCDFCHTITGFRGDVPGDGNYIASPGTEKYGPFHMEGFHRSFSALHTSSRFCALCHDGVNTEGLRTRTTYQEWSQSPQGRHGVQCQHCHMNLHGYLKKGSALFRSGKAADMTMGNVPDRKRLYSHGFPGGEPESQLRGAVAVKITAGSSHPQSGEVLPVRILLRNVRAAHKVPGGGNALRLVWLEVVATNGTGSRRVPMTLMNTAHGYDLAGAIDSDRRLLGTDVPPNARVYRTVFADAQGNQLVSSHNAKGLLLDNRLEPGKTRGERYLLHIPEDMDGSLVLTARVHYLRYPSTFARQMGLPPSEPVLMGEAQETYTLARAGPPTPEF